MEDLGAAVERIMADPAFSKMVKELGGGDGGDLMEKLPRVMETLGPMLGGSVHEGEGAEKAESRNDDGGDSKPGPVGGEQTAPPQTGIAPDGIPAAIGRRAWNRSDAEKLFLALKPYLGERRRDLADRCVSLLQMGELLKAAGLISGGRP